MAVVSQESKILDYFNECRLDLIDEDCFDQRSEDNIFYEAVDSTCYEFGITAEEFYKIYCANTAEGGKVMGKGKNKKARKNVSQTVPNGRTIQTRDEYLGEENKDYKKPGYEGKGLYRKITVVDSNRKNELVVIKLTTSDKGIVIEGYREGKSKFRPYIIVEDDNGNPIKIKPSKFKENSPGADIPKAEIAKIKKILFKDSKQRGANRRKVRELKGRQKKGRE